MSKYVIQKIKICKKKKKYVSIPDIGGVAYPLRPPEGGGRPTPPPVSTPVCINAYIYKLCIYRA